LTGSERNQAILLGCCWWLGGGRRCRWLLSGRRRSCGWFRCRGGSCCRGSSGRCTAGFHPHAVLKVTQGLNFGVKAGKPWWSQCAGAISVKERGFLRNKLVDGSSLLSLHLGARVGMDDNRHGLLLLSRSIRSSICLHFIARDGFLLLVWGEGYVARSWILQPPKIALKNVHIPIPVPHRLTPYLVQIKWFPTVHAENPRHPVARTRVTSHPHKDRARCIEESPSQQSA